MQIQPIGKSMLRVTVKSESRRKKYGKIPGVIVQGDRVIFPESLESTVERAGMTRKEIASAQMELF
ncbi:MAG: hypothetical protein NUV49_04225 [Patescibacteria group bacterium]|nr:hypothetical protein [Patescibacteria group bacterium]